MIFAPPFFISPKINNESFARWKLENCLYNFGAWDPGLSCQATLLEMEIHSQA